MTESKLGSLGFTPFENNFNGYTCRFLRREYQFVLKLFSRQLLFTKNDSLAVFTLEDHFREFCESQIAALLHPWINNDVTPSNPFSANEKGSINPLFIRLAAACTYFYKKGDEPAIQCSYFERHDQGSCFAGRVAISIKGVKYSPDRKMVSPIMNVCQILEHDLVQNTTVTEMARTTCIIDDTPAVPTAAIAPTATTANMNDDDTQSLGSDNERVLMAYLEAESRRLDEETDSAIASADSN